MEFDEWYDAMLRNEKSEIYTLITQREQMRLAWNESQRISNAPILSDGSIEKLVNSFLSWPLPDSVCSDQCATQQGAKNRTGTNLLTYIEAAQMFEYLLKAVR